MSEASEIIVETARVVQEMSRAVEILSERYSFLALDYLQDLTLYGRDITDAIHDDDLDMARKHLTDLKERVSNARYDAISV